jgi:hypothetical protein
LRFARIEGSKVVAIVAQGECFDEVFVKHRIGEAGLGDELAEADIMPP